MTHTSSHGAAAGSGAHGHGPHRIKLNHEPTDIPLAGTSRAALVTFGVIGLVMLLMYGLWGFFVSQQRKVDQPKPALADKDYGNRLPAVPRLQSMPNDDLARYRAAQDGKLQSYGWVDRGAGVIRLPIARAIALMAERASTIADPKAATAAPTAQPAVPTAAPAPPAPAETHGH